MRCSLLDTHSTARLPIIFFLSLLWLAILTFILMTDPIMMILRCFTQVKKGSLVEYVLSKEIEGIRVSAYLYNITNAEAFLSGEDDKLKVEEVGPFSYREYRQNLDIEIDTEAKVLRYTPTLRMEFLPDESIGDPHKINVTVPNLPMLGLASKLSSYPYLIRSAFNMFTKQINSKAIINIDVHSYLWGYNDTLVTLAHTIMPGNIRFDKMGLLDRIYDQDRVTRVELSIAEEDKFKVNSINGYKKLQMGEFIDPDTCSVCHSFDNVYEGFAYPMEITKDFPIRVFRLGLCRIVDLDYYNTTDTYYGAEGFVYHLNDNFFTLEPNTTSKGIITLPDCFYGVPLAFSKVHFVDSDPSIYERIEGIKPDNRTMGWVVIDPKVGMTLETVLSLQLNLDVGDVSSSNIAKSFTDLVLPVCYFTVEQSNIPIEAKLLIICVYYVGPYTLLALKIILTILILLSWVNCIKTIHLHFKMKHKTVKDFTSTERNAFNEMNLRVIEPLVKDLQKDCIDNNKNVNTT